MWSKALFNPPKISRQKLLQVAARAVRARQRAGVWALPRSRPRVRRPARSDPRLEKLRVVPRRSSLRAWLGCQKASERCRPEAARWCALIVVPVASDSGGTRAHLPSGGSLFRSQVTRIRRPSSDSSSLSLYFPFSTVPFQSASAAKTSLTIPTGPIRHFNKNGITLSPGFISLSRLRVYIHPESSLGPSSVQWGAGQPAATQFSAVPSCPEAAAAYVRLGTNHDPVRWVS